MATKYKKDSIILSKVDDLNHDHSRHIINTHRHDNKTGLVLPIDHAIERENMCGYCGKSLDKTSKGFYFGEVFHAKCCEAMLRGERAS